MDETGTIKVVDILKGFGFITPMRGREVFFHVSNCSASILQLKVGDMVRFQIVGQGKRRRAINVNPAEVA
ncbi:cold shock domain-containing protein [Pollutimonas sp. H1-120]|uniref:cold shock domain-containing protein n=1 Tax=Pollutimonas sp. H1-120 TaxID=3148824 RepID=UPI003B51FA7E